MPTSFATQLVRNAIATHAETTNEQGLQSKELQSFPFGALKMFDDVTDDGLLTPQQLEQMRNLEEGQSLQLNLYQRRAKGSGAQRVRKGTGSAAVATVTPTFFSVIQEGLDMSFVNQMLRQYGSSSDTAADRQGRISAAYQDHMNKNLPQVFRALYERLNDQLIAWVVAQKWDTSTTADSGTFYTTLVGDYKQIPTADAGSASANQQRWLQRIQTELKQNKYGQEGAPYLLHGHKVNDQMFRYAEGGAANSANIAQFLGQFQTFEEATIDESSTNGKFYVIDRRGVAMYFNAVPWSSHPKAVDGVFSAGGDEWFNIEIGSEMDLFNSIPVEVKAFSGYEDNFATYTVDPARIDIVENLSFVIKGGALKSYYQTSAQSPILGYQFA